MGEAGYRVRETTLWREALRGMVALHPVAFEHEVADGKLMITMVTVDSRDGKTPIRPMKTVDLPTFTTVKAARKLLREYMRNMVLHELDEWIEVDGVRIYFPHADAT